MRPYIEIHNIKNTDSGIVIDFTSVGETIVDTEGLEIDNKDLLKHMNSDLPIDLYTATDITNETIKQYLTEKVL